MEKTLIQRLRENNTKTEIGIRIGGSLFFGTMMYGLTREEFGVGYSTIMAGTFYATQSAIPVVQHLIEKVKEKYQNKND